MSESPPALFETMRAEDGRIARLDLHLARLLASSTALGIPFDPSTVDIDALELGHGVQRIRLTLGPDGEVALEAGPYPETPIRTAWVCPDPVAEAGGPLCIHKTTNRAHYNARWRRAQALGADEAILLNPEGEVMEGTRTSVWIERDGQLWTPPLSSGGLPGVERAYLLAMRPEAGECVLRPIDLELADAIYLSNALRGLMRVELVRD